MKEIKRKEKKCNRLDPLICKFVLYFKLLVASSNFFLFHFLLSDLILLVMGLFFIYKISQKKNLSLNLKLYLTQKKVKFCPKN
jgi:hypothetical protein